MGERGVPRPKIIRRVLLIALVAVMAGAVGGYLLVPSIKDTVDGSIGDLRRRFLPSLEPVRPQPGGAAASALDLNTATWWQGRGATPSLSVRFDPPVDLGNIVVTGGAGGEAFTVFRRPRILTLDAGSQTVSVVLTDSRDFQSRQIDLHHVSDLRITVSESFGAANKPVAIRELEFSAVR